jgi:lysozyme
MKLSTAGAHLIEAFEGFRSAPYRDAVGVWTIGFGSTAGVGPGTAPMTRAQAEARMMREVDASYGAAVNGLGLPLNQNQFDALVSFVYNVGTGGIGSSSTVGMRLRQRDWPRAADALLAWDKAGGRALPGLTRRRHAERDLFLRPVDRPDPLEGYTPAEKKMIREYDTLVRRGGNAPRRLQLRAAMAEQRQAIWRKAQPRADGGDGRGWEYGHRRERYASLRARTS